MLRLYSGTVDKVTLYDNDIAYKVQLGLQKLSGQYTKDGMPYGYGSVALTHIIDFLEGIFPSTVSVSVTFPKFNRDDDQNVANTPKTPYVAVRGMAGHSKEVGIGRTIWETPDSFIKGFNQTYYLEFYVYDRTQIKCDQLVDQIALQFQMQKGSNGVLHQLGFQNFHIMSSDTGRGFRYDTAWDFKMQHQFARFFYGAIIIKTTFDVVWEESGGSLGTIKVIYLTQEEDIPISMIMGGQTSYLMLEELYYGWHDVL